MAYLIPADNSVPGNPVYVQLVHATAGGGRIVSVTTSSQAIAMIAGTRLLKTAVGSESPVYFKFGGSGVTVAATNGNFDDFMPPNGFGWIGVPPGATHVAVIGTAATSMLMTMA
ncbi:MAG: hypothetical protein NZ518_01605 [Dehalococcoidia bacterium]|nr:hypothetical protein [Dehalococcoidia bacterium]